MFQGSRDQLRLPVARVDPPTQGRLRHLIGVLQRLTACELDDLQQRAAARAHCDVTAVNFTPGLMQTRFISVKYLLILMIYI